MNLVNFRFDTDADGIGLVTWDMPGRSMNVITPEVMAEMSQIVDKVATDASIKGAVVSFGKGVRRRGSHIPQDGRRRVRAPRQGRGQGRRDARLRRNDDDS